VTKLQLKKIVLGINNEPYVVTKETDVKDDNRQDGRLRRLFGCI
jgi:hypothetical protein